LCLGVGWEVVCSREESRKEGSNSRWLQQQNGVGEAGSYNLRSGRPPRSIFPMPACLAFVLSPPPPPPSRHTQRVLPPSAALRPVLLHRWGQIPTHASQKAANTPTPAPARLRCLLPKVWRASTPPASHAVRICKSKAPPPVPRTLLHTEGPPLSGTWVDGWMDGWRLCRVSLADNCPSWL
jgi:hypothetical protein